MSSSEIGEELESEKVPAMLSTLSPVSPEEASKSKVILPKKSKSKSQA